jgi:hypothetical protein
MRPIASCTSHGVGSSSSPKSPGNGATASRVKSCGSGPVRVISSASSSITTTMRPPGLSSDRNAGRSSSDRLASQYKASYVTPSVHSGMSTLERVSSKRDQTRAALTVDEVGCAKTVSSVETLGVAAAAAVTAARAALAAEACSARSLRMRMLERAASKREGTHSMP